MRQGEIARAEALAIMKVGSVSVSMVFMEQLAIKFLHTTNIASFSPPGKLESHATLKQFMCK